jgi:hypothetical protein
MPSVIFLRAVNMVEPIFVERHCSRNQLAKFGVVNTGAVGTFAVREDASEPALPWRLVTLLLIGTVKIFLLSGHAKQNVLMQWIVANDVVRSDIVAL